MKIRTTNFGIVDVPVFKIAVGFLSVALLIVARSGYYIVNPGETAIHLRMGSMLSQKTVSGVYLKFPVIDNVIYVSNRILKARIETESLSHDLQFVSIGIAINYKIEDVMKLYRELGTEIYELIINPLSQETIKAIVAQYTAEGLIQNREEAKEKVGIELRKRLAPFHIYLIDFNFVHLDFHKDFLRAVEEKQIAMQSAMTAKNLTEKVKEEAIQSRTLAEAEAYAMKVKRESVNKDTILLKAIEKWDGSLPHTIASDITKFMDIKQ